MFTHISHLHPLPRPAFLAQKNLKGQLTVARMGDSRRADDDRGDFELVNAGIFTLVARRLLLTRGNSAPTTNHSVRVPQQAYGMSHLPACRFTTPPHSLATNTEEANEQEHVSALSLLAEAAPPTLAQTCVEKTIPAIRLVASALSAAAPFFVAALQKLLEVREFPFREGGEGGRLCW
jgi:hypothetical protein